MTSRLCLPSIAFVVASAGSIGRGRDRGGVAIGHGIWSFHWIIASSSDAVEYVSVAHHVLEERHLW